MNDLNNDKDISSAEMTAYWRSLDHDLSQDTLSHNMASELGKQKAIAYLKNQYPLADRHFSLRARYFKNQAENLLLTNNYDAIISIGSGFSLLTHLIANTYHQHFPNQNLIVIDSDIEKILTARKQRLSTLKVDTHPNIQYQQLSLDIEKCYNQNQSLTSIFHTDIKCPIFILEGLTYFLSESCLHWLFQQIQKTYIHSAIIWDYWPSNLPQRSPFFNTVLEYFKQSLPENVNSLISPKTFETLTKEYNTTTCELADLERKYIKHTQKPLLTNEQIYIPARLSTLTY